MCIRREKKGKKDIYIYTYITREIERKKEGGVQSDWGYSQGSPLGRCGSRRTGSSTYKKEKKNTFFLLFFVLSFGFWEELAFGPTDNKDPLDMLFFFLESLLVLSGLKERRRVFLGLLRDRGLYVFCCVLFYSPPIF